MNKLFTPALIVATSIPSIIHATEANMGYFTGSATNFANMVGLLPPVLVALALAVFIWGLVKFIWNSGDESAKQEGKNKMIWGLLAMFIIISIWGVIQLLQTITNTAGGGTPTYPGS